MQGQTSVAITDDEITSLRQLCDRAVTAREQQEADITFVIELLPRLLDALHHVPQQQNSSFRRIPVAEQLPIPGQQVLCFMPGRTPFVGWITKIQTWMPCPHNDGHAVTHWSPLPPDEKQRTPQEDMQTGRTP